MGLIDDACNDAQTTLDGFSCDGLNVTTAQNIIDDSFASVKDYCTDLHLCGATIGGKRQKTVFNVWLKRVLESQSLWSRLYAGDSNMGKRA